MDVSNLQHKLPRGLTLNITFRCLRGGIWRNQKLSLEWITSSSFSLGCEVPRFLGLRGLVLFRGRDGSGSPKPWELPSATRWMQLSNFIDDPYEIVCSESEEMEGSCVYNSVQIVASLRPCPLFVAFFDIIWNQHISKYIDEMWLFEYYEWSYHSLVQKSRFALLHNAMFALPRPGTFLWYTFVALVSILLNLLPRGFVMCLGLGSNKLQ